MSKQAEEQRPKARKKRGPARLGPTHKARQRAAEMIDPKVAVATTDPLRLQILAIAIQRPVAASEFAREVDIPIGVAAYHFRVLRDNEFLELVEEIKVRGSIKYMYRATKSAYISDTDWSEVSQSLRPGVAGTIIRDFSGRVVQAIAAKTLFDRDDACLYWAPRTLDETAWKEQVKVIKWCIDEVERLEAESLERQANGESSGETFPVTFAIAGFPSPASTEATKVE